MENRIASAVERVLGSRPVAWRNRSERGCTPNLRWSLDLEDGTKAFVKAAVNADTASWLRAEYRVYSQVQTEFMPHFLGWCDESEFPILILENLDEAYWPPPWTAANVATVRTTLEQIAALQPVPYLPQLSEIVKNLPGWLTVARNPRPFLNLGLCSAAWLEQSLPSLMAAEREIELEGNSLVHCDLRSDNLCLRGESAVLIDWNHACIGNAQLDVMSWLPSLHAEGGPEPEEVVGHGRGASEFAAYFSGYWAASAGMPPIPNAPRVRPLQLQQLKVALPWAARALQLPPLDGYYL
jgi:hypothetical protein